MTEQAIKKPIGKIRIYGCGGTGVKIAGMFEGCRNQTESGMASVSPVYLDTAFSDLPQDVSPEHTFLFPDTDGSGGLRPELASLIVPSIPTILELHPTEDLAIVISSGSGGSGSVIAPSLVSELVKRGKPVIAFMVGDSHTVQWMKNTIGTIRSYNGTSITHNRTVPLAYFENTDDQSEQQVNVLAAQTITAIAALWSRQNQGLDSKDLENFLNPEKISDFPAQLAMLRLFTKSVPAEMSSSVMTTVSLAASREAARLSFIPEAQYVGLHPKDLSESMLNCTPLHLAMLDQSFTELVEEILARARENKKERARRTSTADIMGGVSVADNGLVF